MYYKTRHIYDPMILPFPNRQQAFADIAYIGPVPRLSPVADDRQRLPAHRPVEKDSSPINVPAPAIAIPGTVK